MKEDDILKIAEFHLGPRFNRGKVVALANEIYGQGFKDGAASMRKVNQAPPRPRAVRKKPAPSHNTALIEALQTLHPPLRKKR